MIHPFDVLVPSLQTPCGLPPPLPKTRQDPVHRQGHRDPGRAESGGVPPAWWEEGLARSSSQTPETDPKDCSAGATRACTMRPGRVIRVAPRRPTRTSPASGSVRGPSPGTKPKTPADQQGTSSGDSEPGPPGVHGPSPGRKVPPRRRGRRWQEGTDSTGSTEWPRLSGPGERPGPPAAAQGQGPPGRTARHDPPEHGSC